MDALHHVGTAAPGSVTSENDEGQRANAAPAKQTQIQARHSANDHGAGKGLATMKGFVDNYGPRCWEVDALSPVVLRMRVEDRILTLLDMDAWRQAISIEPLERESMKAVLTGWQSTWRQVPKCAPRGDL